MPTISKSVASALRMLGYKNVRAGKISNRSTRSGSRKRTPARSSSVRRRTTSVRRKRSSSVRRRTPKRSSSVRRRTPSRKRKTTRRKSTKPKRKSSRAPSRRRTTSRAPSRRKSSTRVVRRRRSKKKVNMANWPSSYVSNPFSDLMNRPLPAPPRKPLPPIPTELYQTYDPAPFVPVHDIELGRNYAPYRPSPAEVAAANNENNNNPFHPRGRINQLFDVPPPPAPPRRNRNLPVPPLINIESIPSQYNPYRKPLPPGPPLFYNPNAML